MIDVPDREMKKVIADFLEMGHVENIVAMFRREPDYYAWTGEILDDERFAVRIGVSVLFEELKDIQPDKLDLAIPSLVKLFDNDSPTIRGEAVGVLGIIGSAKAWNEIMKMQHDPNPQVREMVALVLEDKQ